MPLSFHAVNSVGPYVMRLEFLLHFWNQCFLQSLQPKLSNWGWFHFFKATVWQPSWIPRWPPFSRGKSNFTPGFEPIPFLSGIVAIQNLYHTKVHSFGYRSAKFYWFPLRKFWITSNLQKRVKTFASEMTQRAKYTLIVRDVSVKPTKNCVYTSYTNKNHKGIESTKACSF